MERATSLEISAELDIARACSADPHLRHTLASSPPASCSRKIPTIYFPVTRLGFMSIPLRGNRSYQLGEEIAGLSSVRSSSTLIFIGSL